MSNSSDLEPLDSEEAARRLVEAFPAEALEDVYHRALDASEICLALGRSAYAQLMRDAADRIRRLSLH
ncbi:hypothetical protein ABOZ73_08655 [Caulobacter sp. 73W]|uniref:Uncharacterized protein n=1 Tax=Caulobacter sp. 73W TaxID=3161137 RepID=A0AB39KYX3_9CAUL